MAGVSGCLNVGIQGSLKIVLAHRFDFARCHFATDFIFRLPTMERRRFANILLCLPTGANPSFRLP
nr:hypothetical protein [uncultured Kingella sp.]